MRMGAFDLDLCMSAKSMERYQKSIRPLEGHVSLIYIIIIYMPEVKHVWKLCYNPTRAFDSFYSR